MLSDSIYNEFIGRTFWQSKQKYLVEEIHSRNSVWTTGKVQYKCLLLPIRPDRQYEDLDAFKCYSFSELNKLLKKKSWELYD